MPVHPHQCEVRFTLQATRRSAATSAEPFWLTLAEGCQWGIAGQACCGAFCAVCGLAERLWALQCEGSSFSEHANRRIQACEGGNGAP